MKQKLSSYVNGMIDYVNRTCEKPSPIMLEVYNGGGNEVLRNADLIMMLHLAVNLSAKYRHIEMPVWSSRELEMIVYDMFVKGYTKQEMLIVVQVASHNQECENISNKAFEYITDIMMKLVKDRGDTIFEIKRNVFLSHPNKQTSPPELIDNKFSTN